MKDHMTLHPDNRTRSKLESGQPALGLFLVSASSMMAEAAGTLGFDWAVIDVEASPADRSVVLHMLQALTGSGVTPFVRVPNHSQDVIEHALDTGALGVVVPKVSTAEQAHAVSEALSLIHI